MALTVWAIAHSASFSGFSGKHWKTVCEEFNISLRGGQTLLEVTLPVLYETVLHCVHQQLQQVPTVAVSFDGWTAAGQTKTIGIVYHFIDSSWLYRSRMLDLVETEESQTGSFSPFQLRHIPCALRR